jgi:hypothetical protein
MRALCAAVSFFFLALAPSARAQSDPNNELLRLIYTKIVEQVDLRRSKLDDTTSQYFFVITQPGIFIDPKLLANDGKEDSAQKRIFSEIIDRVMLPSWVYGPKDETYHDYYKLMLDTYDYKPLPLPPDKKQELADADAMIYSNDVDADGIRKQTAAYKAYLSLQDKYLSALGDAQAWLNTHPGASTYPRKEAAAIDNAMAAWQIAGKKTDIEKALEAVERYDHSGYWSEARQQYKRTGDDLSLHNYYPSIATWLDKTNTWPSITVGWSKGHSYTYNHQTSASGGGSFSVGGFFSVGTGGNYSRIQNIEQNEATAITVKFEYLRVDFRRPWLTRRPFSDRRWRFACGTEPEVKKWIVSSGPKPDVGGTVQYPSGIMPMIPTGFLIVRNATVTGNFSKSFKEYYKQVISKSSSGGWGPFSIRGSFNDTTEKTQVDSQTADNGFTVGNPQIIGFFTEVLPSSPEPLPGLFEACDQQASSTTPPQK